MPGNGALGQGQYERLSLKAAVSACCDSRSFCSHFFAHFWKATICGERSS
jgi:hypothetical protein